MSKTYLDKEETTFKASEGAIMYNAVQPIYVVKEQIHQAIDSIQDINLLVAMKELLSRVHYVKDCPSKGKTDAELEKALEGLPSWDEVSHQDTNISLDEYKYMIRTRSRKPMKGIGKWL